MRRGRLVCLALAAALLLTACERRDSSSGDGTALTVMGRETDMEKSYMTAIFRRYEEATGNKLELIAYPDEEFETTASRQFAEGKGADVLLHFHNTDLDRFDPEERFIYLDDQPWVSDLTAGAANYCRDDRGNLLGLPFWENSVSGCYYNKTLLDSLGLKAAATQAEFDVLCQTLADMGYIPLCWPGDGCSWMFQFGLDPVFADDPRTLERLNSGEISFSDIPAVTDMVRWISDAADRGWLGKDYLKTGWSDIAPALSSGRAVMTLIWDTWFYTDFTSDGPYGVDDFALMPVFLNTADEGTYEGGNLNMMMVNRDSPRKDAALEFLAFCAEPENYNAAFDGIATASCFKGQTTNIRSRMVSDAAASIAKKERVSTAASMVLGYSGDDMMDAVNKLLAGKVGVDGCVALMDRYRAARLE